MTLLSIVTITFNDLIGLRKTIKSVDTKFEFCSRLSDMEHIIIDGNSTDGTKDYLRQLVGSRIIRTDYLSEPDSGIYDAMNKGVLKSLGHFVVFLNSGDEIYRDLDSAKLFSILENCNYSHDEAGLAFSSIIKFSKKTFIINSRVVSKISPRMPTVHQSMFFKRCVLLDVPFDISYKVCGDYDNFSRIFSKGLFFGVCSDVFSVFYAGGVSSKSPIRLFLESSAITKSYFGLGLYRRIIVIFRLIFSLVVFQVLLLFYGA